MAPLAMTLSDLEGQFCCLKPFQRQYLGKYSMYDELYDLFTRESNSAHFVLFQQLETEGLFKVTGSHVHGKIGNISETLQHRDVVTTDH